MNAAVRTADGSWLVDLETEELFEADVDVPATQWMTTYYWRFSTNNGQIQSGYTGWSSFYRSL